MFTLDEWKEDKNLQDKYEKFYQSDLGKKLRDVLVDIIFQATASIDHPANAIELKALDGNCREGMYRVVRVLESLRPEKLNSISSTVNPVRRTELGLPFTPDMIEKFEQAIRFPKSKPNPQ